MTPYYERNGITIYVGDCLEIMPQLDMMFDAIIADLPYGTTACNWDTVIPFEPLWENYKRLVKGNGAVVLFGSQPFTSKLVMSNLGQFKYEWVWEKDNHGSPAVAKFQPMRYHENIIVFCKNATIYHPQKWEVGFASNRPGKNSYLGVAGTKIKNRCTPVLSTDRYPKSIIKFNKPKNNADGLHPTQKPVALLQYLIRTYTDLDETILDNTMGSGTTLVAAQNEGRRAVGIELSEDYCKIAVDRLRQTSFFSIPDKPKSERPEQLSLKDV